MRDLKIYLGSTWANPSYHLHAPDGEPILETKAGRIFVRGQETSDVERIGAAFRDWAKMWTASHRSL